LLTFVLLIVAGVGLLRMKESGRKLSVLYGIYAILLNIAVAAVNFHFIFSPQNSPGAEAGNSAIAAAAGVSMEAVFGFIYPVALIYYMTRPEIRKAFLPPEDYTVLPTA
jgi:hypothetical protein